MSSGIDVIHVPYKGGGPALAEVLAGQVQALFSIALAAMPQVGRVSCERLQSPARSARPSRRSCRRRRSRLSRLRGDRLVRLARAGRRRRVRSSMRLNAELVRVLETSRGAGAAARARARSRWATRPQEFAAFIRSEHDEVGEGHQGGEHQSRMIENAHAGESKSCRAATTTALTKRIRVAITPLRVSVSPAVRVSIRMRDTGLQINMRYRRAAVVWAIAGLSTLSGGALAQDRYPSRAVRLVVPFAPGGGADISARAIAARLTERLGQQVLVDNRPGAGGNVGTDLVSKSAPDGYTLVLVSSSYGANPSLYKLSFDPVNGFEPITLVSEQPFILVVHPSLPVRSVKDLIVLAKAKPGSLNYASSGAGGIVHLGTEYFKSKAGIDMVHIPYKGGNTAHNDLVAGFVQVYSARSCRRCP